jgi:tetratricopeptide (TPR) repeat protein
MKYLIVLSEILLLAVITCVTLPSVKSKNVIKPSGLLVNRIDGIVWDPYRQPVPDVYVELQNEMYMSLNRIRTTSSGRFSFTVANPGNYVVRVLTSGTNYLEASEAVEIVNVAARASDSAYLDIYLKFDKRKINTGDAGIVDAVFVQDVPADAKKLYETAVKNIRGNRNEGFDEIDEALKIYPDYFDALNFAGKEYVQRKEYQKSLAYLIHSIDVNQRSYSSFYALAYACYQLNHRPEATEAARGATMLQPDSVNAQLLYGTLLRLNGDYEKAEKALLHAKNLNKSVPEIHWQLALLFNKLGRNNEAIVELEAYLKDAPNAQNKKEIQELIAKLKKGSSK